MIQFQVDVAKLETFGFISGNHSKKLLEYHFNNPGLGWDVTSAIIYSELLNEQSGDELLVIVKEALEANPNAVKDIKAGKDKAIGSLLGYVMKKIKVDPKELHTIILVEIEKL